MSDKSVEELIREKVVDAGGGGRATEGPPSPEELKGMLSKMRFYRREARAVDERDLASALTTRDKDDIRYRMLWGEVLYRKDVDRLSGRSSSRTRAAEDAMKEHVDMMNETYGVGIDYPKALKIGDPIPVEEVSVHEIPTERRPPRVVGVGRVARPDEEL